MLGSWSWNRIIWSLRKVRLPICADDLILDVGSGNNPHPAADILLERHIDPTHRFGAPVVIDRPVVLGNACKMPFKNKTFDYIIAFHVLEHMADPVSFLKELQRVGKAGYIETPNAMFERLIPYDVHLLEVMCNEDTLLIHKKKSARPDPFINKLDIVSKNQSWKRLFYGNPDLFHVRYFWKENIQFKIVNPEVSCDWFVEPVSQGLVDEKITSYASLTTLRSLGLLLLRLYYRFRKKKVINLEELLVCPECYGALSNDKDFLSCFECRVRYPKKPVRDFNRPVPI